MSSPQAATTRPARCARAGGRKRCTGKARTPFNVVAASGDDAARPFRSKSGFGFAEAMTTSNGIILIVERAPAVPGKARPGPRR